MGGSVSVLIHTKEQNVHPVDSSCDVGFPEPPGFKDTHVAKQGE